MAPRDVGGEGARLIEDSVEGEFVRRDLLGEIDPRFGLEHDEVLVALLAANVEVVLELLGTQHRPLAHAHADRRARRLVVILPHTGRVTGRL